MEHPGLFGYLELKTEGVDDLPSPKTPYYLLAKDGFFFHKSTLIGEALMPLKQMPGHLANTGYDKGVFWWNGDTIPAAICAQAVDFFRRIYKKYQTEAEVYITKNAKTGEYRLFIPTQRVTGASVSSSYDPAHISRGWQVVGTMHSHCMMSAFHSGTDMNDASDIDGLHITVGKVMDDKPEAVAMVMFDGVPFHYPVEEVADFSDLTAATAPEWWDRYVNKATPQPPKHTVTYAKGRKWQPPKKPGTYRATQQHMLAEFGWGLDPYDDFDAVAYIDRLRKQKDIDQPPTPALFSGALDDDLSDAMLSSNLLTEEDFDENVDTDLDGFRALFMQKMGDCAVVLRLLGYDVDFHIKEVERQLIAAGQIPAFTEEIPL